MCHILFSIFSISCSRNFKGLGGTVSWSCKFGSLKLRFARFDVNPSCFVGAGMILDEVPFPVALGPDLRTDHEAVTVQRKCEINDFNRFVKTFNTPIKRFKRKNKKKRQSKHTEVNQSFLRQSKSDRNITALGMWPVASSKLSLADLSNYSEICLNCYLCFEKDLHKSPAGHKGQKPWIDVSVLRLQQCIRTTIRLHISCFFGHAWKHVCNWDNGCGKTLI